MVCLNPRLREELLLATKAELRDIADAAAPPRKPGQANRDRMSRMLGARGNKRKVLKHFDIALGMDTMTFGRKCSHVHPLADVPEKAVPVSGQAAAGGVEEGTRSGTRNANRTRMPKPGQIPRNPPVKVEFARKCAFGYMMPSPAVGGTVCDGRTAAGRQRRNTPLFLG